MILDTRACLSFVWSVGGADLVAEREILGVRNCGLCRSLRCRQLLVAPKQIQ